MYFTCHALVESNLKDLFTPQYSWNTAKVGVKLPISQSKFLSNILFMQKTILSALRYMFLGQSMICLTF
jgi:hypothetical protein